ncbi:MAG: nitrous oxide reductase accessory protein NosL [Acidobacteriota bacterium]
MIDRLRELKNETAKGRRGDPAKSLSVVSVAASPRRRVAPSLFLLVLLLSTPSCGPKRNAPVAENAQHGYCPVCGMQVKASDPWAAEIRYSDGTKLMFESPGDMLAFYVSPTKYSVNDWLKQKGNMKNALLKDYNTRESIDAANAELVVKSRVDGPMGPDFFPFSTRQAAELFAGTNGGSIVRLADVTVEILRELGRN